MMTANPSVFPLFVMMIAAVAGYWALSYLGRKQYFPVFILCIAAAVIYASPSPESDQQIIEDRREKMLILKQQTIFGNWYTEFKKDLDRADLNWQQYHKTIKSYKNDEISIQTVHVRLTKLQTATKELKEKYARARPPEHLAETNHNLVQSIIDKMSVFTSQQNEAVLKSLEASDPNAAQAGRPAALKALEKIMIISAPTNLDIAREVLALKENLTTPNEN